MERAETISIVIADDHSIVREGIAALIQTRPELRILGQCGDGLAAVEMITSLNPEFAVIDLNMPKLHGIEVIRKVREASCPTKLIVLSISRDENTLRDIFRSGANGYLLKDGPSRHLFDAITYIRDGGQYVTPLLRFGLSAESRTPDKDPLSTLSRREYEVFSFLVDGMRPKDIARLLDVSPKTVDTYRSNVMRKLGINDVVGLVKFAIERNLISTKPQTWRQ